MLVCWEPKQEQFDVTVLNSSYLSNKTSSACFIKPFGITAIQCIMQLDFQILIVWLHVCHRIQNS
jgi:hypothetical protein